MCEMKWTSSGQGPVAGFCERGDECHVEPCQEDPEIYISKAVVVSHGNVFRLETYWNVTT
jgi:hypothetical protein